MGNMTLHRGVLTDLDSGDTAPLRQIGKGAFATVYEVVGKPDRVVAIVPDCKQDFSKELLARIWEDERGNPHIPYVRRLGSLPDSEAFVMPRYQVPLRAANKVAWADYRTLERCWRGLHWADRQFGYVAMEKVLECAEGVVSPEVFEALETLRDYASDYGSDYTFEFAPRNLGVDKNGTMILLDVVFSMASIQRIRAGKGC